MHGARFDAWTRREFGLALGGAAAAALGLALTAETEARNKKKKKRCRKIHQACSPGSTKKRCCNGLRCDEGKVLQTDYSCCRNYQARCQTESQCCNSLRCLSAVGLDGTRCCSAFGFPCVEDSDCCLGGFPNVFCNDTNMCSGKLGL